MVAPIPFPFPPSPPRNANANAHSNGGPGCSGLFGALAENGWFRPNPDGATLAANPFSWNLVSNMVYIEVPVGVGFSFSGDERDYDIGDRQTAVDNYHVVQAFLDRYPHLRGNDFYLTSESYGGHYIPTLAQEIVLRNREVGRDRHVNLRGFAVGNPYTVRACVCVYSHIHSLSHTHTHSHTFTLSLSLSHTHTHAHIKHTHPPARTGPRGEPGGDVRRPVGPRPAP